jgi:hypothetical protein
MTTKDKELFRAEVLHAYGATDNEAQELLAYNRNVFDHSRLAPGLSLPLPDEPFVSVWEEYVAETETRGAFDCLKERLVQLNFPIQQGISLTENYRAAVRRGVAVHGMPEATGLSLERPECLRLALHQTAAGRIPVITAGSRADFVSLAQAFLMGNEPRSIPAYTGAYAVGGYNNWDRVRRYRKQLEQNLPGGLTAEAWKVKFKEMIPHRELYQDCFILLSDGPYSGVTALEMGLPPEEWSRQSLIIRAEHECAHYATRRLLGSMRMNLFDEILADYMGIAAALGYYRSSWFLRFMGLEGHQHDEPKRTEYYRGDPPLSDGAFEILERIVKRASQNLEYIDGEIIRKGAGFTDSTRVLISLCRMTLEELASDEAVGIFSDIWDDEVA